MIDRDRLHEASASLLDRCRFPAPGTIVTCGVSGGADSTALVALAVAAGAEVEAVHVDHGLRPGSADEARAVAASAEALGVTFRAMSVAVEPGPNLEARARTARHLALPAGTLLGHTADDQAETVLLNLLRGSGPDGLAGIRSDTRHPILALRRAETVALCQALGLTVVDDPSNRDPAFRRNRVRHELVPLLADIAERDPVPVLARQASVLRETTEYLDEAARDLDPRDAAGLVVAPVALARVAVRRWLRPCSPEGHPPSAAVVERVLAVARQESRATQVGGGWRVARTAGRLRLEPDIPSSGVE